MSKNTHPNRIENQIERYYRRGTPRPLFVSNLREQLLAEAETIHTQKITRGILSPWLKFRPAWRLATACLLAVTLLVLAIGPQKVLAAVQGVIGYLPSLGFIQDYENARVLAQPATVTQQGVSVTVENAVVDETNTRILLEIKGLPDLQKDDPSTPQESTIQPPPQLTYPGGSFGLSHYALISAGSNSFRVELVFSALPEKVIDPVLIFKGILIPQTVASEEWRIPLHFETQPIRGRIPAIGAIPLNLSATLNGITLTLDSVARLDSQDALRMRLSSSQPGTHVEFSALQDVLLLDPDGHPVLFVNQRLYDPPAVTVMTFGSQRLVPGRQYTLSLAGPVELSKPAPAGDRQSEFTVDLGTDPQPGQSWMVGQTVLVDGQSIHIASARMRLETGGASLFFAVDPEEGVSGVTVEPGSGLAPGEYSLRGTTTIQWDGKLKRTDPMVYFRGVPKGRLAFRISAIDTFVQGPWTIKWQMPD